MLASQFHVDHSLILYQGSSVLIEGVWHLLLHFRAHPEGHQSLVQVVIVILPMHLECGIVLWIVLVWWIWTAADWKKADVDQHVSIIPYYGVNEKMQVARAMLNFVFSAVFLEDKNFEPVDRTWEIVIRVERGVQCWDPHLYRMYTYIVKQTFQKPGRRSFDKTILEPPEP